MKLTQVALYARVSSEQQNEARTIESQLADLRTCSAATGVALPAELEFVDNESTARPERRLLPAEVQARSRVTALIEYGAEARYVLVCPSQGLLPFAPDTPEWFDWLATLTSFRFVGKLGRFHAHRETKRGQHTRSWRAYRTIHQHAYRHYLGTTDQLTLAALEQAAATLQAKGDAL
jgi:hypothetical protein